MTEQKCAPLAIVMRPGRFATPRPPTLRAGRRIARLCEFEPPMACPLAQALRTAGTDVIDENSGPGPPAQSSAASSAISLKQREPGPQPSAIAQNRLPETCLWQDDCGGGAADHCGLRLESGDLALVIEVCQTCPDGAIHEVKPARAQVELLAAASSAGHQQLAPTRDALDQAVNSSHELPVFRRREELAMYLDKMSQVHSAAAGAGSPDSIRPDDLPPSSGIVSTGRKRLDHPSKPDGFRLTSVAVVVLRSARSPLMSSQRLDEIAQAFLARKYDPDASAVADAIVREALAFGQTAPAREEPPAGAP